MIIGRLGRDNKYKGEEIGTFILKWAIGYIQVLSEHAGVRYITVDAYPERVSWYKKLGFIENLHKRYKGNRNISMRYDLHNPPKK